MKIEISESIPVGRIADLYSSHMPAAVRLAYVLTGSAEDAQDIAQEAFIRVVGRFADLRSPEKFTAYLRRAVINAGKMRARRELVAKRHRGILAAPEQVAHGTAAVEERDRLTQALRLLPERQRAALALRFYCDLSEAETAEILGCRRGTVKSLVSRGAEAMRVALGGSS